MKRLLLALGLLLIGTTAAVSWADQKASRTPLEPLTVRPMRYYDTVVIDSGGTTWLTEEDLPQPDSWWNGGNLKVIDVSSDLTDSTRTISTWTALTDSMTFSAFSVTLAKGDSVEVSILLGTTAGWPQPESWSIDSVSRDTSGTFTMNPGASITSTHLIEIGDNQDSANTYIILQIALKGTMPNNQIEWWNSDSVLYQSQDTVIYQAWGAKQAHLFRFIVDPVQAPFSASHAGIYYQCVIVDK